MLPLKLLGEDPSLPLSPSGSPRHSLASSSIAPVSVFLFIWLLSLWYVSRFSSSYKDTSNVGITWLYLQIRSHLNKVTFTVLGLKLQHIFLADTIQLTIPSLYLSIWCKNCKTTENKDKPYYSLWKMIPFRKYLNIVRNENSYLGLGDSLILGQYKCFINKCVIKKGFYKKRCRIGY